MPKNLINNHLTLKQTLVWLLNIFILAPITSNAYTTNQGVSLSHALQTLQTTCGVKIKLAAELQTDKVNSFPLNNCWQATITELLTGYNYMVIWHTDGHARELDVYSRNNYSNSSTPALLSAVKGTEAELFDYQPTPTSATQKIKSKFPGAITKVTLPIQSLKEIPIGEKVTVNLPNGQFTVIHDDNRIQQNGDITWIGHLLEAGKDYKTVVSSINNSIQGRILTPEGEFMLQTAQGETWLIEAPNNR
jgi:hypothetical protein